MFQVFYFSITVISSAGKLLGRLPKVLGQTKKEQNLGMLSAD